LAFISFKDCNLLLKFTILHFYLYKYGISTFWKSGLRVSELCLGTNWNRQYGGASVVPIVEATKSQQVEDIIGATNFRLPQDAMAALNEISAIEAPSSYRFFNENGVIGVVYGQIKDKIILPNNHMMRSV
jgi:hypothetical protein